MYNNQTSMGEPSSSRYTPTERSRLKDESNIEEENYGTVDDLPLEDTHRNKRLCTYIILFITILTTLAIFIVLWLAPTFAERTVQKRVQFRFETASILDVSKENTMSLHVVGQIELEPTLHRWSQRFSSIFGQVDVSHSELSVMHDDQPIGSLGLPALSLNTSSAITEFNFTTQFIIQDSHAFMNFCKQAVESSTVIWHISGPLSIHLGWTPLWSNVELDKNIELEGMNGLKETEMQHMSFPGPHPLGGVSISGTVGLFNPSDVLSFHLGDVDFGIYLPGAKQDVEIAIVRAIDANLQGNQMSYFNVTGRTLPIQDQQAMSTFLSRYLHGQVSLVNVRGSLQAPDPHYPTSTPDWLKQALQQLTIQVPFPGAEETDLIQDLQLSHIKIDFSPQNTPLISADVSVFLKQPPEFHFDLDVNQIQPTVYLYLNLNSPRPFALVHSPEPCPSLTSKLKNHRLLVKSKLVKAPFRVLPGGQKEFEEFLRRVFYEKRGKVYIRGKSDAQVDSAFGQVQVQDLEFEGVIEIQGMQGLGQPQILDISLVRGYQDALEISTLLDIYNPSNAAVNLGNLNLALLFNHYPIGHVLISSLALDASSHNHVKVSAWLEANNPHVVDFISQYISTGMSVLSNVNLTISGDYPNATTSPWLLPLINALSFNVAVPPFDKEPILADCRVNLWSSTAVMSLRNPFSGMFMTIEKINASATYKQIKVGDMEADFADASEGWKNGPILLPGPLCESDCIGVIVESEKIPVKTKKVGWDAIRKAMGGSIVISVESQVGLLLDDFRINNLNYIQNNITAKVKKEFFR